MSGMRTTFILTAALLVGCAPPEAPDDLQELAYFIFDHADDEDEEVLRVALENLSLWFDADHEEDIEEGYQINLLPQEAVSDLEGDIHTLREELIGAAVAHRSSSPVMDIAHTTSVASWVDVIGPEQYEYYDRTYIDNDECIGDRSCLSASARSESELVQLGISITSKNKIEYRWVETDIGWVFLHRSWLTESPIVSSELVKPNSQYFLAVTLPRDEVVRVQATWIDTEILGVQVPKNQVVKTMREQGDKVQEWMDANL